MDRVIQQAAAQVLSLGYERYFSEYSYGFRPGRDCHGAVAKALEYLNEEYPIVGADRRVTAGGRNFGKRVSLIVSVPGLREGFSSSSAEEILPVVPD